MLHKDGLTSHSKISGSRWVITPSRLSGFWGSFLYNYSVYSWHHFLIHSASVKSVPFPFFILTIFAWNIPFVRDKIRKYISYFFPFHYFPLFALFTEVGFLISPFSSLELYIRMYITLPLSFVLASLLFSVICIQTPILAFCLPLPPWGWSWSLPFIQFQKPLSITEELFLSDLIPWIYLSFSLCNHKGYDLGPTWRV